ncbi:MAG: hypothetical protein IPK00_02000 [Deltaproteobacteria bacterium]|nr:hypothetical protein [Deltaproteobacteria bacterium]
MIGWLGLLTAPMLRAEPHRVEVVGAYPIREALRGKVNPRDEAIQKALWEGVSRVALELIGEEGTSDDLGASSGAADPGARPTPGPKGSTGPRSATAPGAAQPDPSERFRKIFGRQILPYTRSFRIVEDRGERPVLFAEEPGVRSEYLVVVEVIVDVDRVEGELARAGLLEVAPGPRSSQSILIELVGLERYGALRLALETLRRDLSASRIETLEFAPRRQLLRIEGPLGPDEIAARLGRMDTAELILDPVEIDREGGRIRVLAQSFEPMSDGAEDEPVTASPDTASPIRP